MKNKRDDRYGAPSAVSLERPGQVVREVLASQQAEDDRIADKAAESISREAAAASEGNCKYCGQILLAAAGARDGVCGSCVFAVQCGDTWRPGRNGKPGKWVSK